MPPMKKQASPAPTPRAAALSQSASHYSAGATSAWQRIVGNSPRLAAANRAPSAVRTATPLVPPAAPGASRIALEPQRAAGLVEPAAEQETVRQVGWREVDRAVGVSTKRKYSVFGIGFGPKVPLFETEKVKLPVYQETNRNKRYYAAVKAADADRAKREGLRAEPARKPANAARTIEQFNGRARTLFFTTEAGAHSYGKASLAADYAVLEFVMPEYQEFVPGTQASTPGQVGPLGASHAMHTAQAIPASCIKAVRLFPSATPRK